MLAGLSLFFLFAIGLATTTPKTTGIIPANKDNPACIVNINPKIIATTIPKTNCLTIIFLYVMGKKSNFLVSA